MVALDFVCSRCCKSKHHHEASPCSTPQPSNYELELQKLGMNAPLSNHTTITSDTGVKPKVKKLSTLRGKKPDIRRLRELDLLPVSGGHKLLDFKLDEDDEDEAWSHHDWEAEPRASPNLSGDAMSGQDVGCTPLHTLHLPSAASQSRNYGICGRSLLTVTVGPEVHIAPSRSVLENKKFLGWDQRSLKSSNPRRPARKGRKPSSRATFRLE